MSAVARDTCPTCGTPVRIVSSDEGTSYAALSPSPEVSAPEATCRIVVNGSSGLARCETHAVSVVTDEDFRAHGGAD